MESDDQITLSTTHNVRGTCKEFFRYREQCPRYVLEIILVLAVHSSINDAEAVCCVKSRWQTIVRDRLPFPNIFLYIYKQNFVVQSLFLKFLLYNLKYKITSFYYYYFILNLLLNKISEYCLLSILLYLFNLKVEISQRSTIGYLFILAQVVWT